MQNSFHNSTNFKNASFTSPKQLDNFRSITANNYNDSIHFIDDDNDDENNNSWKNKPDIWSDDVRMNALFAPFRNRDLNPLHYDNKLKFWKDAIISYCKEKQIIQFDLKQLENAFIRKNIQPKCLELVLNELLKEKTILSREDALKPKTGLIQNMFNKLVWSPISWSTSYFFKSAKSNYSTTEYYSSTYVSKSPKSASTFESSFSKSQSSPGGLKDESNLKTYVHYDLIESKSQEILKILQSTVVYRNVDCVIEYDKCLDLIKDSISEKDLDLILKYLEINRKVIIINSSKKLIKFSFSDNQNVESLNEIEESYLKLKDAEKKLEFESDKLSAQIESLTNDIKTQLKQGNKNTALKLLRKKKNLEKSLENKDSILNNIETMIMSIQQTDTNQVTIDVFTKGASALKEANKGINIDQIDDTMCEIQDIYNQNTEIEDTLARSPISSKYVFDEQELNDELNELLSQNTEEFSSTDKNDSFKMDDLLKSLPTIPYDTPKKATNPKASQLSNY